MKFRAHPRAVAVSFVVGAVLLACGGDDDPTPITGTGSGGSSGNSGGSGPTSTASGSSGASTGGGFGGNAGTGGVGGSGGAGAIGGSGGSGGSPGSAGAGTTGGRAGSSAVDGDGSAGANVVEAGRLDATDAARDATVADTRDVVIGTPDVAVDGAAGCGLANVLSKSYFDAIFPLANRNAVYTYEGLVAAAASYPAFANTGSLDACRKETAAFLANVARETGRLRYAEEIAKAVRCTTRTACVCDASTTDQTKWYYGRGAIQLTWNYNYCAAGTSLSADLLGQPSAVHTDAKYAWATALWYWMTSKGGAAATCHDAIAGTGIFGDTIRAINGGECGGGGYGSVTAVTERVDAYIQFAKGLGIADPGMPSDLDC
jgi:predicted chitinase